MPTRPLSLAPAGLARLFIVLLVAVPGAVRAAPGDATPLSAGSTAPPVEELPLPVVGRWAETLPLHGGPVLDLFRMPLPELPWLTAVYRGSWLTVHLGLLAEGGWTNAIGYDSWRWYAYRRSPFSRFVPEARLSGEAALRGGWRLAWGLSAAVDLQLFFVDPEAEPPVKRLSLVELRARAEISVARSERLGVQGSVELLRFQTFKTGADAIASDVLELRLGGRVPLGRVGRLRLEAQAAIYLSERLDRLSPHGPVLAATELLRLEPQARIAPRVWLGFLLEGGRVDFDRALAELYPPPALDGWFVRALATVEGRPRPWVSYRFGLGYGALLLPGAEGDQRRVARQHASVAHGGLVFRPWKGLHLRLGYWRDFEPLGVAADFLRTGRPTPLLGMVTEPNALQHADAVHLGLDAHFWDRLVVRATFGWRGFHLGGTSGDSPYSSRLIIPLSALFSDKLRVDNLLVQLEVDVFVTRWLALGASYLYQSQAPGGRVPLSPDPYAALISYGYVQHRAVGRVTLRF